MDWRSSKRESHNSDIVFLTKGPGRLGDALGRLAGDGGGSLKSKEFAPNAAGLDDTVSKKREDVAGRQRERGFCVIGLWRDAERQAGVEGQFFSAEVGRQVAGIGEGNSSI